MRVYAPGIRHPDDYQIEHSLIAGHGNQAFIPDPNGRDWLTPTDVSNLSRLQAAFASAPDRIRRAAWFFRVCRSDGTRAHPFDIGGGGH